jgi:hypothetical protein
VVVAGIALALAACEGSGSSGGGLVVGNEPIARDCEPVTGTFPSGLAVLPDASAVLAQGGPSALVGFDLDAESPRETGSVHNIPLDSDLDGTPDAEAMIPLFGFPLGPTLGGLSSIPDARVLLSTSNYEQVLVFETDPGIGPASLVLQVPAGFPSDVFPLLPAPGEMPVRTGISTLACIFAADLDRTGMRDSRGDTIGPDPICHATEPSFVTSLTAGTAIAEDHLYVAMSNLAAGDRFHPGTLLVYEWEADAGALVVRPDPVRHVIQTTGFNPTGLVRHVTATGRQLVLVTVTGDIGSGTGPSNIRSEAAIDVVDPLAQRVAATIPLGFAGPSFDSLAIDRPEGARVALVGSSSQKRLFGVDLAPLDDEGLYAGAGPPVTLDGMSVGHPDARIFHADAPLVLPDRPDGAPPAQCAGVTSVAFNEAGTQAFATDLCDGDLSVIFVDLQGDPPPPLSPERFRVVRTETPFAPNDAIGLLRSPSSLRVRPGRPGVDYTTPDVFAIAGQPSGQLCALRVESQDAASP